ncbi:ABC transporter ATP-binding protein [Hoeflea alexandrii]|uniref:ABC transporter ATP-binding protein n=1 Tax=Hoeflea alexandrii TaxID=288436 RepID=UPI0022AF70DB|nr:ABC transporter ATP-binding protein [Hoeflea alexandrii]MCZ4291009.1 ABC transporter ATP-binding protein [Hoeflea alexandrii]
MALLELKDLRVHFRTPNGINRAVDGLDLVLDAGETVAIVGESGSGKSVASMSILRLLHGENCRSDGEILYQGRNLLDLDEKAMRRIRGNEISMIFQEPMTALNPVMKVGRQISEAILLHQNVDRDTAMRKAQDMLDLVGIPESKRRLDEYPHQLSGGMRQRVMIAIALACEPSILIADEPTTALDVTIQAQILDLVKELKDRLGTSVLIVTHDLGVVAEVANRVVVMYAGQKVEEAGVGDLFAAPLHPYTEGLLRAMPKLGTSRVTPDWRLAEIPGQIVSTIGEIKGCVFANRCNRVQEVCHEIRPALRTFGSGRVAACHFPCGSKVPDV